VIAELKPYPEYKASNLPWVGGLPMTWGIKRGKALFSESTIPVRKTDEVVTCFRDGQVTLRRNRRASGFMLALHELGYQGVRKGQLVVHAMDAFAGAIGVSDSDGKCTPEYIVANSRSDESCPRYFARLLRFAAHQGYILVSCPAVRERAPRFRYSHFGTMLLPVPPPADQTAIVRFLDHWDRRLDKAIRAKRKQLSLVSEMLSSVTQEAMAKSKETIRIWSGVEIMSRPVDRKSKPSFVRVGIFNRGRGIFKKPTRPGDELGDSDFYWIEEGDLVISGQFAWEGSVALVRSAEAGCIASHRYPIIRGKAGVISSATLLAILRSSYGAMILNENSRGAAGRNRRCRARRTSGRAPRGACGSTCRR